MSQEACVIPEHPYVEADLDHESTIGLRVARGGSWYSASIALLYLPYRDTLQPKHSSQDLGFRLVARRLPCCIFTFIVLM